MFLPPLSHTFISTYLPVERKMQTMRLTSLENCNFNPPTRKEQDACEFWAENAAGISIHLPVKSKTVFISPFKISLYDFNPLACKEQDLRLERLQRVRRISIHLPVKSKTANSNNSMVLHLCNTTDYLPFPSFHIWIFSAILPIATSISPRIPSVKYVCLDFAHFNPFCGYTNAMIYVQSFDCTPYSHNAISTPLWYTYMNVSSS